MNTNNPIHHTSDVENQNEETPIKINRFLDFQDTFKERLRSRNCESMLFLIVMSLIGILAFVLIFAILPMPLGYLIYLIIYPSSEIFMFSILTWSIGFFSMIMFSFFCTCCCFCVSCCVTIE